MRSRRFAGEDVIGCVVDLQTGEAKRCCANFCLAKLSGLGTNYFSPSTADLERRKLFIADVLATRNHMHGSGQTVSRDRLTNLLRLGSCRAVAPPSYAAAYSFPAPAVTGGQQYIWQIGPGVDVQVC